MKKSQIKTMVVLSCLFLLPACNQSNSGQESGHAEKKAIAPVQKKAKLIIPAENNGRVKETFVAGGYTYVRVDASGKDIWLAGPKTAILPGVKIGWPKGTKMTKFTSPTLKRTFDTIYFVPDFQLEQSSIYAPSISTKG